MKSIHKFFSLIFLCCLLPAGLSAQQQAGRLASDSVTEGGFSWRPSALRVGLDLSRLVSVIVTPDTRFYELNSDLQFGSYYLSADWGTGYQSYTAGEFNYLTEGNYFRLGADINFIPESEDNNMLFVGVRYGQSFYNEQLSGNYGDPVFGSFPVSVERAISARWFEGVAGLKARVWEGLFMGYTLRYKLGVKAHNTGSFTSYEVPGFGVVGDGNTFAFNYHVFYRIPFR